MTASKDRKNPHLFKYPWLIYTFVLLTFAILIWYLYSINSILATFIGLPVGLLILNILIGGSNWNNREGTHEGQSHMRRQDMSNTNFTRGGDGAGEDCGG